MTEENPTQPQEKLLERILQRVISIDRHTDEILERLSEHFEDAKYAWLEGNGYDLADYDNNNHG